MDGAENRTSMIIQPIVLISILLVSVSSNELYQRVEFLIFMGCVCGLLLYFVPPRISDRDKDILGIFGIKL